MFPPPQGATDVTSGKCPYCLTSLKLSPDNPENSYFSDIYMVPQEGLEPPTPSLRMRCATSCATAATPALSTAANFDFLPLFSPCGAFSAGSFALTCDRSLLHHLSARGLSGACVAPYFLLESPMRCAWLRRRHGSDKRRNSSVDCRIAGHSPAMRRSRIHCDASIPEPAVSLSVWGRRDPDHRAL